ncbi:hypothetical protein, partial [Vibrio parahaemolyticus]|uniref:hypothetical protein n=1 Tax=Vibrio parahaemolyticus TaxID=670 RepID=UPI003D2DFD0E
RRLGSASSCPFLLALILADSGQGIGFRQCVLHERAVLLRFGLADLGPYPFHLGRTVPGQLGGLVDAVAGLAQRDNLGAALRISTAAPALSRRFVNAPYCFLMGSISSSSSLR